MKVSTGNAVRATAASAVLAALLFVVLVEYAPDSVALSPNNYGWNGLQGVSSQYKVNFTTSLSTLPAGSVLVVMQPSLNYSAGDVREVRAFLSGGGTLLVADKSGFANSLLSGLGSHIVVQGGLAVEDATYNWKARSVPTALVVPGASSRFKGAVNVTGLALNLPSPLRLKGGGAVAIADSSQLSFAVNRSELASGGPSGAGPAELSAGPFVVAASEKFGNGTVFVLGDPQFLLNSEWKTADNAALIGNLFSGGKVFIDASHWLSSPLGSTTAQVKAGLGQIYGALSGVPARYALVAVFVAVAIALTPTKEEKKPRPAQGPPAGVSRVLERIRKDRESDAGDR